MKTQETLSESTKTSEVPKIKLALEPELKKAAEEEAVKEAKRNKPPEKNKLPIPTGWRILVLPFQMKEKTRGGVILAETVIERQQVASQCGLVLAMGPDCYRDKERYREGPWCKIGDWVLFARYAGSRIKIEGGEVRMLNDDEVLATVKNPEDLLHEY